MGHGFKGAKLLGEERVNGPFGQNRVCGVVAAKTSREMRSLLLRAGRETRTLELRLDYLRSARERDAFLRWLGLQELRATLIATCRGRAGGGLFRGSQEAQMRILAQAVRAGCSWCDVEIESAKPGRAGEIRRALSPSRVMISYHNFRRTPRSLSVVLRRVFGAGGEVAKVAALCNTVSDSARICELAKGRRDIVSIPMGELGLAGRILALRAGSPLVYAAVDLPTAPGQLSLRDMKNLYGAEQITRRTRVYGVIGNPIGHSLSPLLHNTGFRAHKWNAVLLPFLAPDLKDFLAAAALFGMAGFGVTIPHKESILRHLDVCDPLAARIGAVNTVVVRGKGRWYGYNTDYVGVLRSLERRMRLAGSRVLLWGAGGAARAAACALASEGATVCIAARRPERARELARVVGAQAIPRTALRRQSFDAIINCTPVGMHPRGGAALESAELNCRIVMDMVYRPRSTPLLQLARKRGLETISGIEMFLAQGAAQFELWTGARAPEAAMRRAVISALDAEERIQGR